MDNQYDQFTLDIVSTIKQIPKGKVASYGKIAEVAGNKKAARRVSRVLHSLWEKFDLPWHRVVNSKGKISLQGEGYFIQKQKLIDEGVKFESNDTINLRIYSAF